MLLTLLVQTLLLPQAPMPAQYLEVQRNWRVDENGAPLLSTEKRKTFAVELSDGQRRKRNLESGAIVEEPLAKSTGFQHLAQSHTLQIEIEGGCLRLIATPRANGTRRHEFHWRDGTLSSHRAELIAPERALGAGTSIRTLYENGSVAEVDIDFQTVVAGTRYRGRQRTTFHIAGFEPTRQEREPSSQQTRAADRLSPENSHF